MDKIANPEMLLLARESRGLTQGELATALGVTQSAVSKCEKLDGKASESYLQQVAELLDFPKSFFFQQEYRYSPISFMHRKKQALPQKVKNKIESIANLQRLHIKKLLDSVELPQYPLPDFDLDDYAGPEGVALAVRSILKIPRGPIPNLVNVIEKLGIILVPCFFQTDKLDGFTIVSQENPIIFFNSEMPWCRIRFSLAHELGHIVLNHVQRPEIEEEANRFASAFLMPEDDISNAFSHERIDLHLLAQLKPRWRVSMQALLMRAKQLGFLTPNQNSYLWMLLSNAGYKKREPAHLDLAPEVPILLKRMIELHLDGLQYSEEELCEALNVTKGFFHELYDFSNDKKQHTAKLRLLVPAK